MHTVLSLLLYALIAAASPFALTATIAVLKTRLARLNGLIFAGGFLLGEGIIPRPERDRAGHTPSSVGWST